MINRQEGMINPLIGRHNTCCRNPTSTTDKFGECQQPFPQTNHFKPFQPTVTAPQGMQSIQTPSVPLTFNML